ncbi:para-nitrobenzyl esterase [Streptomyces aurantiacus]|uniref:carboxylesterase/lipase family protein n=1 Tax=Streptomyces aurantiacus TaxID=47760 RepID=UPI0027934389|nr:carboxylesterase family protein [Streptomyces aurantiacus]MDQ0772164.1 para-nitrobenzyl esterase [Streptomyces aurantiacus]
MSGPYGVTQGTGGSRVRAGGAGAPRAHPGAGRLVGEWDGPVAVFRGIPFAAPPVGDLRWRPPRPAARWDGERRAEQFGPAPLQPQPPSDSVMYRTNFADRRALVMSEDCLYLNVWTPDPAPGTGLPVMVWIHGGGNRYGHGSQDIHDGRALAGRGQVVVTLNHRLGALGFLAHPGLAAEDDLDASGNYGLLDIVAALTWIRTHVAAFGGDPDRITLAGNSAGAAHICHLMAAPTARPHFRAALGQSASGVGRAEGPLPGPAEAQKRGLAYAEEFGGRDVEGLRRISGVELIVRGHFGPVVDGRVLTEPTDAVFATGRQHRVPLLVGSNRDEGTVYASADEDAGAVGDARFVGPVWQWARSHAATGTPTWIYRFDRRPPLPPGLPELPDPGVHHTAELPYVLDNLDRRPDWPWQDTDRRLAALMADTWARFVATGDPGGPDLPPWPRFTGPRTSPAMFFGDTVRQDVLSRPAPPDGPQK